MSQLFTSGGQIIGVSALTSVQHQSNEHPGLISFRVDWFDLLAVQGTLKVFSNTTVQKHQFLALSFVYSPTLTPIKDCWTLHKHWSD